MRRTPATSSCGWCSAAVVEFSIVAPYARIQQLPWEPPFDREAGIRLLRKVEYEGRVSHDSQEAMTEDSWDVFLRKVILNHGDWSITGHASVTVEALVDRGITHEWVRHRLGNYTQESTRFVNYNKGGREPRIIQPNGFAAGSEMFDIWHRGMSYSLQAYRRMLQTGASPQIARSALPTALASQLVVTYSLNIWRYFFIMRTTREAHPQMRQVTVPLLEEFKAKIPILFEDIEPGMKQSEAIKLPR